MTITIGLENILVMNDLDLYGQVSLQKEHNHRFYFLFFNQTKDQQGKTLKFSVKTIMRYTFMGNTSYETSELQK